MEKPDSIKDKSFIQSGIDILNKNGELLTLTLYPYSAGSRDFLFIKTEQELLELLEKRKPKEIVYFFKTIEIIKRGFVDDDFIIKILETIEKPEFDWLIVWSKEGKRKWYLNDWYFINNKAELEEELRYEMGREVTILIEPNLFNNEISIYAYASDEDGIIRHGAY